MNNIKTWVDDIARGFVCTYHPVALGSNPKQTIYAFSSLYYWNLYRNEKKHENKRKRGRDWPIYKKHN